jgi:hypothetical protein
MFTQKTLTQLLLEGTVIASETRDANIPLPVLSPSPQRIKSFCFLFLVSFR